MNFFEKMGSWVWNYKTYITILALVLTLFLAPFAGTIKPDNSFEAIAVRNDPNIILSQKMSQIFGSDEYMSIMYETDDAFSASSLAVTQKVTQYLKTQPYTEVLSLTNLWKAVSVKDEKGDALNVVPFIPEAWIKTGVPPEERKALIENPLYKNLIYNESGKAAAILARFPELGHDDATRSKLINEARAFTDEVTKESGVKFFIFGLPVMNRSVCEVVEKEQNTLTPIMIVAILLLIIYLYRNWFVTLITFVQLLITMGITVGTLGLLGVKFNWLTTMAPAVIVIMNICDSVYIINEFQRTDYTLPAIERMRIMFKNIGAPCLFTSIINGFGFLSLVTSVVNSLQDFGLYVFIAVIVEYAISFTIFPILLNNSKSKSNRPNKAENPYLKLTINKAYELVSKHPSSVGVGCMLLIVLSLIGISELQINQSSLKYFKNDTKINMIEANNFARKGVGGGVESDILHDTDTPGLLLEPQFMKQLDTFAQAEAKNFKSTNHISSIADLVKYFNQVLHNNDPTYYKIPDTRAEIEQIMLVMEMNQAELHLRSLINLDYSKAVTRIFSSVNETLKDSLDDFDAAAKTISTSFSPEFNTKLVSKALSTSEVLRFIPHTIVVSLLTSGVFIAIAMIFLFRSVKVGLLSLLPSALPLLMVGGFMGFFNIWINIASAMTFAVSLGIAMDDTVNIIWRMKKYVEQFGLTHDEALKKVFDEIGVPLISSSLMLAGGYLMLSFSQLWPTTHFGVAVACCCMFALIGDLLLIPVIFLKLKPFKAKAA
ncbi:MMPL family transporter [bacterium]|nr:MMPL family transporter [bacterium]